MSYRPPRDDPRSGLSTSNNDRQPGITPWASRRNQPPPHHHQPRPPTNQYRNHNHHNHINHGHTRPAYASSIPEPAPYSGTSTANANAIPLGGSAHPSPLAAGGPVIKKPPQVSPYRGGAGGSGRGGTPRGRGAPRGGGYGGRGRDVWTDRDRDGDRDRDQQERDRVERERERERIERDRIDRERERGREWERTREVDPRDGSSTYRTGYADRDRDRERERERERERDRERDYRDDRPGPSQQATVPPPLPNTGSLSRSTGPSPSTSRPVGVGTNAVNSSGASIPTGPRASAYQTDVKTIGRGSRSPNGMDRRDRDHEWEREREGIPERRERSPERGPLVGQAGTGRGLYGNIVRDFTIPTATEGLPSSTHATPPKVPQAISTPPSYSRPSGPPLVSKPFATPISTAPAVSANHTPLAGVPGPSLGVPTGPRSDRHRVPERGGYADPKSLWNGASDERDGIASGSTLWNMERDDRNRGRDRWERGSAADANHASRYSDRASVRSARSRESSRSRARTRSHSPQLYGSSVGGSVAGGSGAPPGYRPGVPPSGPRAMAENLKSPSVEQDNRPRFNVGTNQGSGYSLVTPRASSPPHRTASFVPPSAGSSASRRYDARSVDGVSTSTAGGSLGVGNWARRREMDRLMQEMRQGRGVAGSSMSTTAPPSAPETPRTAGDSEQVSSRHPAPGRSRGSSRARSRSVSGTRNTGRDNGWPERHRSASSRGSPDRALREGTDIRRSSAGSSPLKPNLTEDRSNSRSPTKTVYSPENRRTLSPVKLDDRQDSSSSITQELLFKNQSERGSSTAESGKVTDKPANSLIKQEVIAPSTGIPLAFEGLPNEDREVRRSPSHVPSTPSTPSTPPLSPAPDETLNDPKSPIFQTQEEGRRDSQDSLAVKMEEEAQTHAQPMSSTNALGLRSPPARPETFDHPPTSPLTEIQPSSPVRESADLIVESEIPLIGRPDSTSNDDLIPPGQSEGILLTPKPNADTGSILDGTFRPAERIADNTPHTPEDAIESELESEESLEPYGKEFIDFDFATHAAAKDLLKARYTNRMDVNNAVENVLAENNWTRNDDNVRAAQAEQIDSWQIARLKANHPSTWVRHIVAARCIKNKEENKRYVQALQEEWNRLDEAWQKQRVLLEEENEQLRRVYEATLLPPTPAVDKDTRPAPRNRRRGAIDTEQQMLGIHDGDEAGLERILMAIRQAEEADPVARARKTEAVIPDMVLEPSGYRLDYDDNTSLVQDPLAFYDMSHKTDIEWTAEEDAEFRKLYAQFPKRFGEIAERIPGRTASECVHHYYLSKKEKAFKEPARGGAKQYKEVPISSIANGRNTITAPRSRMVGMVRGNKALIAETTGRDPAGTSVPTPLSANPRKQPKRKLDEVDKTVASTGSAGKEDVPTAPPPKVRKKPGPKPGQKRNKSAASAATAPATVPSQVGESSTATPAVKKRRTVKPKAKKGADLTLTPGQAATNATRAGDQPITPGTASTIGAESLQRDTDGQPYTAAGSALSYPESMSFRPGISIGGWSGQPAAASAFEHSAPYLPPIRDFMSVSRNDSPTSNEHTYAPPSMHYPPGPSSQKLSFGSTLPPAPAISIQQDGKESSAPPQVFRRSNINDLLNASSDETSQSMTTSRSVPPPERGPVMPSNVLASSAVRGSPARAIDGSNMPGSFDLASGRGFPLASPVYPYHHDHPANPEYHSDRTQDPGMRDLVAPSIAERLGSEPSLGRNLDRQYADTRRGFPSASDLYQHHQQ